MRLMATRQARVEPPGGVDRVDTDHPRFPAARTWRAPFALWLLQSAFIG